MNSPGTLSHGTGMANPYTMGPLYHSPGVQSYCTPTDNLSLAGHYTDMSRSAGWYGSTANDPRFASKLPSLHFFTDFMNNMYWNITNYIFVFLLIPTLLES